MVICVLIGVTLETVNAQNFNRDDYYRTLSLNAGYSYSFGEPNNRGIHLLDIGLNKMRYGGRHGAGYHYGLGTEIALNTDRFVLAPKVSGAIYINIFVLGTELTTYTDFDNWTLRLVPFFGLGGERMRITVNPNVLLSNDDFNPINRGLVNISYNIILERKREESQYENLNERLYK